MVPYGTYVLCHNFLIGKGHSRAHMCTENHVCFGRIHGSQLRRSECRATHTYTLATALTPLPPHTVPLALPLVASTRVRTRVPWYTCTMVRTYVRTYMCTYTCTMVLVVVPTTIPSHRTSLPLRHKLSSFHGRMAI